MEQRISLVTLGVGDLDRSRDFYEALGWTTNAKPDDDVVFFQAGGIIIGLWDRSKLALDSGVENASGFGGVVLALNQRSPEEVDVVMKAAERVGANITRKADKTFWGGYSGVFLDPDGHPWEIAHNPRWTVHDDGSTTLAED